MQLWRLGGSRLSRSHRIQRSQPLLTHLMVAACMCFVCVQMLHASDGVMLVITYGQPTSRLPILERKQYSWSVTNVALGPTRFMYACKKKEQKK